ncbi:MAG: DUF1236 domain-containing protein [Caulobacteraceae bacterium]
MTNLMKFGAVCLSLAATSPALAQSSSTTTVNEATGATTTTTTTVEKKGGGTATGAVGGAVAGALVAGPVGLVVGGIAGATVGHKVAPPGEVKTYVTTQTVAPASYSGPIEVGDTLRGDIAWRTVPAYPKYSWAYLNDRRVVIDSETHKVVDIY